jgi:hypothetical protein
MLPLKSHFLFFTIISGFYLVFFRQGLFFNSFNVDEITLFFSVVDFSFNDTNAKEFLHGGVLSGFLRNAEGGSLDPGSYSVVLSLWSLISTKTVWLRSLSSLFFLLGLTFLFSVFKKRARSNLLGLLFILPIFGDELLMNLSYTMRPYALEICGTCFLIYFMESFRGSSLASKRMMIVLLSFFLGSRYFFWFPALLAVTSEYIFSNQDERKVLLKTTLITLFPLSIYLFSLYHQLGILNMDYLRPLYFFGSNFKLNLEFLGNFSFLSFLSFLLIHLLLKKKNNQGDQQLFKIAFFLTAFFLTSLILDIFKVSPFNLKTKYTASFHVLAFVFVFYYLVKPISLIFKHFLNIKVLLVSTALLFLLKTNYTFNQDSHLVPIILRLQGKYPKNSVVYCSNTMFDSINFLKKVVKANYEWSSMPRFERLNNFKALESDGATLVLVENPLVKLDKKGFESFKINKVFGDHYEHLYSMEN